MTGERDRHPWRAAVLLGLGFAAAMMAVSLWWAPSRWVVPPDIWMVTDAGRKVWEGALGFVYQSNFRWYSLPLSAILIAPAVGLGDHLHLVDGYPVPLPHPSMWLVVGPYTLCFGILALHATRRLAWDLGLRRHLLVLQAIACVVVLLPAAQWGHFEDVVALSLVLHAVVEVRRSRPDRAALALAFAISSKQWALLVVPVLLAAVPAGRRARFLAVSACLPVLLGGFALVCDWRNAFPALFSPQVVPNPGHPQLLTRWAGGHASRTTRDLAVAVSALAGWWAWRRRAGTALLVAVAASVCLFRAFSEPFDYSYYWSPGLLLAGMVGVAGSGRMRLWDWLWPVLALAWSLPGATADGWWWVGELLLLGGVAGRLWWLLHPGPAGRSRRESLNPGRQPAERVLVTSPAGAGAP